MFITSATRQNISYTEAVDKGICLHRQTKWVKSLSVRMQTTDGQKAQEMSITHTIYCGLVVAHSLITMLAFINKQTLHYALTKTCQLHIVYCSYVCPAPAEQKFCLFREGKIKCLHQLPERV